MIDEEIKTCIKTELNILENQKEIEKYKRRDKIFNIVFFTLCGISLFVWGFFWGNLTQWIRLS